MPSPSFRQPPDMADAPEVSLLTTAVAALSIEDKTSKLRHRPTRKYIFHFYKPSLLEMLPAELLDQVLDFVSEDVDDNHKGQSYYALCLTSKRISKAAMPFLYRHLTNLDRPEALTQIVENLAKDSFLARKVKELRLIHTIDRSSLARGAEHFGILTQILSNYSPDLSTYVLGLISQRRKSVTLPLYLFASGNELFAISRLSATNNGEICSELKILMAFFLTPNVEHVTVDLSKSQNFKEATQWFSFMMSHAVSIQVKNWPSLAFRKLQSIDLRIRDSLLDFQLLRYICALPSLTKVSVMDDFTELLYNSPGVLANQGLMTTFGDDEVALYGCEVGKSNISHFGYTCGRCPYHGKFVLGFVARRCAKLEYVSMAWDDANLADPFEIFVLLLKELASQAKLLKTLKLEPRGLAGIRHRSITRPLETLKLDSFAELVTLVIDGSMLFDIDPAVIDLSIYEVTCKCLPPKLENLTIHLSSFIRTHLEIISQTAKCGPASLKCLNLVARSANLRSEQDIIAFMDHFEELETDLFDLSLTVLRGKGICLANLDVDLQSISRTFQRSTGKGFTRRGSTVFLVNHSHLSTEMKRCIVGAGLGPDFDELGRALESVLHRPVSYI